MEPRSNPFGTDELARSLGCLYLAGAALGAGSLLLPRSPSANVGGLVALVVVAALCGAALLRFGGRLPAPLLSGSLVAATLLISAVIILDGHAASVYAGFYVPIVIEAWCFLTRREAIVHLCVIAVAYAGALVVVDAGAVPAQRWLLTIGTALVAGVLVSVLRDRIVLLLGRLHEVARTDPLTGLPNRRAFNERFDHELRRARERGTPLTVAIGDLDGFKLVNDRLGHHAGDEALCRLSRELETWKRRGDVAARLGGEEFALLLPGIDEQQALRLVERLRSAVRDAFGGFPEPLTISFGIAAFPVHGDDAPAVMRAADQALYGAKELGRDRTVGYSAELAESLAATGARAAEGSEMQLATVVGLAEALDIRDTGTARHSRTVGRYAGLMATELGLEPDRIQRIRMSGMIHDVGKIGISDRVLTKAAPLDDEEWVQMRTHPQIGARLLARPELSDLRGWILAHHERLDGRGYPFGLPAQRIPLEARILSVADAYEAMTAGRVYRAALGRQVAREELRAGSGTQFDGEVVEALLRALDRAEAVVAA